jgi:hypothetical protein
MVRVPSSDLSGNLAKLLEGKKGADVTFRVGDDLFPAHKIVLDSEDRKEMVKHLLVAADRCAVERLKLICEGILCRSLEAKDVDTTLALADTHHCHGLREACVAFLASSNKVGSAVASQEVYLQHNDNDMRRWSHEIISSTVVLSSSLKNIVVITVLFNKVAIVHYLDWHNNVFLILLPHCPHL